MFSASQGKLALIRIRKLLIPLPTLPEQQEIVRRVDALFAFADSIEAKVTVAREKTEKLKQSILAKAFSGELVEIEAEIARREGRDYESAEVLIERIKEERGKGGRNDET
ncbi:restriction endonuclease subunit S [Methanosarcina mazei]|uniref:restriction endonuclease subunit S n=1 Tax=Methanosarcina mazei TaxID=2209 RepID=UPI00064E882F|nr:restriction endonuclease subunit S [Methanosarcina mazei]